MYIHFKNGHQQSYGKAKPCTHVQRSKGEFSLCKLNKTNVVRPDLNDDSVGALLTSFGIEFQTEEKTKENAKLLY